MGLDNDCWFCTIFLFTSLCVSCHIVRRTRIDDHMHAGPLFRLYQHTRLVDVLLLRGACAGPACACAASYYL